MGARGVMVTCTSAGVLGSRAESGTATSCGMSRLPARVRTGLLSGDGFLVRRLAIEAWVDHANACARGAANPTRSLKRLIAPVILLGWRPPLVNREFGAMILTRIR